MTRLVSLSKDMVLPFSALATFAYVLFWLLQHRFMEQPHHYVTALVIVGWLAVLPFVAFYTHERNKPDNNSSRLLTERRN